MPEYTAHGILYRVHWPTLVESVVYAYLLVAGVAFAVALASRSRPAQTEQQRPVAQPTKPASDYLHTNPIANALRAEAEKNAVKTEKTKGYDFSDLGAIPVPSSIESKTEKPSLPPFDTRKIAREAFPAVVSLLAKNLDKTTLQATGFFIRVGDKTLIVTNAHVVSSATSVLVKKLDGKEFETTGLRFISPKSDLALLAVAEKESAALPLGQPGNVEAGEKIVVIGSPKGFEGSISEGLISAKRGQTGHESLLQITAAISSGSSGSPVLNAKGEVVGVVTGSFTNGQAINFAVSVEELHYVVGAGSGAMKPGTAEEVLIPFSMIAEMNRQKSIAKEPKELPTPPTPKVARFPAEDAFLRLLVEHPKLRLPAKHADSLKRIGLSSQEGRRFLATILVKIRATGDDHLVRIFQKALEARDEEANTARH